MVKRLYKQVTVAGILMIVPVVLIAGVFCGYALGDWLREAFHAPQWVFVICVLLGFAGSIFETTRMLRLAMRIEKDKEISDE